MTAPQLFSYRAELIRIIDGDSLQFLIDLGFHTHVKTTCRLVGINCPEMNTKEGKAARAFVEAWFASSKTCIVSTVKDKREKYGRWLARVTDAEGCCLNETLVIEGLAVPYME